MAQRAKVLSLRTSDVSERRSLFPRPHLVARPPCSARPRPFQCTHPPHPASISHSGSSQLTTHLGPEREPDCRAYAPARCSRPSQLTPYPAGQALPRAEERSVLSPIHSMSSSPLSSLERTERRPKKMVNYHRERAWEVMQSQGVTNRNECLLTQIDDPNRGNGSSHVLEWNATWESQEEKNAKPMKRQS